MLYQRNFQKVRPYLLNIGLTSLLLIILAILFRFTPFGHETMLTVDLGQQYIDFFNLFKQAFTTSPEQFVYSFQKAFGGEMIGLWAYYLMSPFNFVLLLFDNSHMALGITIITYLKLIASSTTFFYFARKKYHLDTVSGMLFSNAYTLMSYTIVFMLNIMWFDGLVLLPLVALGLDRLIHEQKYGLYITTLATMLIVHYYIGYMMCLFLAMYAAFVIIERQDKFSLRKFIMPYVRFGVASIIAALISGIVLVPTFMSLIQNKVSYMKNDFNWETSHNLQDVASKFFIGSFNFDEMSKGSPNLYAGMIVLIFALCFFIVRRIKWSEKIMAFIILCVFYSVFHFRAFDRIWHGGQFPIWYHFRFSFMTTFFLIIMALKAYQHTKASLPFWLTFIGMLGLAGFTWHYYSLNEYKFLTEVQFLTTLGFGIIILIALYLDKISISLRPIVLLAITCCELFTNAAIITKELSYVDLSKFNDYVATLDASLNGLRHSEHEFYRIHTTFQRSKNEAMFVGFNGVNHFGSTIEAHVPKLFGYLGLPDGNGFANYTNGTLFTDDFFNIRYLINPTTDSAAHTKDDEYILFQVAKDIDIKAHPLVSTHPRYEVYENSLRLGLGMEVSNLIVDDSSIFYEHQPIRNQELLLKLIDTTGTGQPYFTEHSIDATNLENVKIANEGDGDFFKYERISDEVASDSTEKESPASIKLTFSTSSQNPFYFTLPSQIESDNASLKLDNKAYKIYTPFRRRQVTNASYNNIQANQQLTIELLEDELQINPVRLYEFDEQRYNKMIENKQATNLEVTKFKHNHIEGTITTHEDSSHILFTIPYDNAWQITVDGQVVKPVAVLNNTLMAIPVTKGTHQVRLHYFPSSIWLGAGISLVGLLLAFGIKFVPFLKNKEQ